MAVNLSPIGGVAGQFFDNNGNPLVGGKLFTYAAGTTTPQVTFTSALGDVPNSNPIILNGGGRVPAEIWLTDGLEYKFVLLSSTDQLIGAWDNITGINSNFVNFVTSEEVQTATAGQTVFTLTTMSYQPGTNNLVVYVDGVNQIEGSIYSFVETSSTVVTFTTGLHVGALVKFVSAETLTGGATSANLVSYTPAGAGAVATNVQAKLRETVSVKDFGAVGDGVTDDTAAIQAAIDSKDNISIYFPDGIYKITSGLTVPQGSFVSLIGNGFRNTRIFSTVEGTASITVGDATGNTSFNFQGIGLFYVGATSPAPIGTVGILGNRLVAPTLIDSFEIQLFFDSLIIDGNFANVGNVFISNFQIGNVVNSGIFMRNKTQGIWIDCGKISGSSTSICVKNENCSALYLSKVDLLLAGTGVLVTCNSGQEATWLFFNNVITDTNANHGFRFNALGTGSIRGVIMDGCWSSSNMEHGIFISGSATSDLDSFTINNHFAINNGFAGLAIGTASGANVNNLTINGGVYSSNNQTNSGWAGIDVAANQDGFQITGVTCGAISSHVNYQPYGINIRNGASSNYIVTGNNCPDNVISGIFDGGLGLGRIVENNIPSRDGSATFQVSGGSITAVKLNGNVASVVYTSTGLYTVTFTTPYAAAIEYSVIATGAPNRVLGVAKTTSGFTIDSRDTGGASVDSGTVSFVVRQNSG